MSAALLCSVCGAPLRDGARFCGRCGGEQGLLVARDAGAGPVLREPLAAVRRGGIDPGRGLAIALGVYFASMTPALVALARMHRPTVGSFDRTEWICGAAGALGLLALGREAWRGLGPGRWSRTIPIAIVACAALLGLAHAYAAVLPTIYLDDAIPAHALALGRSAALLHFALLPALAQELAFRGAALPALRGLVGDRGAIAAAAVMSSLVLFDLPTLPVIVPLGAILGAVRVRTGSVWPCVLLHAGFTAGILVLGPHAS